MATAHQASAGIGLKQVLLKIQQHKERQCAYRRILIIDCLCIFVENKGDFEKIFKVYPSKLGFIYQQSLTKLVMDKVIINGLGLHTDHHDYDNYDMLYIA